MNMDRNEIVKDLFETLRDKVPARSVCRILSRGVVEAMGRRIDFKPLNDFLDVTDLCLNVESIPKDLWFEFVLYLILDVTVTGCEIEDWEIFNLDAPKTEEKVYAIREFFEIGEDSSISKIALEDFLAYAKSNRADF